MLGEQQLPGPLEPPDVALGVGEDALRSPGPLLVVGIDAEHQDRPCSGHEPDRPTSAEQGADGALGEVHRRQRAELALIGDRRKRREHRANVLVAVAVDLVAREPRHERIDNEQPRLTLCGAGLYLRQVPGEVQHPAWVLADHEVHTVEVGLSGHQPRDERLLDRVLVADDQNVGGLAVKASLQPSPGYVGGEQLRHRRLAAAGQPDEQRQHP